MRFLQSRGASALSFYFRLSLSIEQEWIGSCDQQSLLFFALDLAFSESYILNIKRGFAGRCPSDLLHACLLVLRYADGQLHFFMYFLSYAWEKRILCRK